MGSHGFAAVALALLGGCATVPKPDATLAVACVPEARVYVDDVFVGRAGAGGLAVAVRSGARRVEVRADGYFTAYRDLTVAPHGRGQVRVELRAVPEGDPGG